MPIHFQIKNNDSEILVWYLTEPEEWFEKRVHLTDNEQNKLLTISHPKMRCSFLALRHMIKEMGYSEILYKENGKPFNHDGFISITHSGNWLGIQISKTNEIGIDIEKIHDRILKIKDRFLSEKELNEVCSDEIEKMTLCWSAKEAIFKKYGGETVFFKDNIEILRIDSDKKRIEVKILSERGKTITSLEYFYPSSDYVLVHTM